MGCHESKADDEGDYKVVIRNEHGEVEFAFKFYVTVEGGMDFRAMLMKRKVKQKKIVVKTIDWLEVNLDIFLSITLTMLCNIMLLSFQASGKKKFLILVITLIYFYLVDQQCCDARNFQNNLA